MRRWDVTFRGRPVESTLGRALASVVVVLGAVLFMLLTPLMVLLHPLLRLFGLRGTMRTEDGRGVVALDREAFRRREPRSARTASSPGEPT